MIYLLNNCKLTSTSLINPSRVISGFPFISKLDQILTSNFLKINPIQKKDEENNPNLTQFFVLHMLMVHW